MEIEIPGGHGCHPAGVEISGLEDTGGVAPLNHRLRCWEAFGLINPAFGRNALRLPDSEVIQRVGESQTMFLLPEHGIGV